MRSCHRHKQADELSKWMSDEQRVRRTALCDYQATDRTASSQAPAPCLKQGSPRAWLGKALREEALQSSGIARGHEHHRVTHTTAGKAQSLREAWKCHYKLECSTQEGWSVQSHSQDKWTYLDDRKKTVLMSTSHEVFVRKLKVGSHTIWDANQDQETEQLPLIFFYIPYIQRI